MLPRRTLDRRGLVVGLSSEDLAGIRQTAGEFLETPITISRKTISNDGAGGTTSVWDSVSSVIGRIEISSGTETAIGGRDSDSIEAVAKLPAGTDVTTSDRLLANGQIYEVFLVEPAYAYTLAHVEAVS